mgnify:CR=1 FL=1
MYRKEGIKTESEEFRAKVVILADEGIEMPSDLSGVIYTDTDNWQVNLLKDLKQLQPFQAQDLCEICFVMLKVLLILCSSFYYAFQLAHYFFGWICFR